MEFLIPVKFFLDIIRNHKASDIHVTVGEEEISIESDGYTYLTKGDNNIRQYPLIPTQLNDYLMDVDYNSFVKLVKNAVPFASNERNRPIFTGLLFRTIGEKLRAVATDGKTIYDENLTYFDIKAGPLMDIVIPQKALKILGRFKKIQSRILFYYEGGNRIECYFDNIKVISYVIEGTFPDWQKVYPENDEDIYLDFEFNVGQLLDISKKMLPFVSDISYKVNHLYKHNSLVIHTKNDDVKIVHKIPIVNSNTDWIEYAVNCKYFIKCLSAFNDDEVISLRVSKKWSSVLIFTGKDKIISLMPLRISNQ